jgi:transcription-repair coupling factor (superfamily II helicase)
VVTTQQEVEDIRTEWEDRYGPVPEPAEALLAVATLRAECVRTGVREISVTPNRTGPGHIARLAPVALRTSATIRLRRLARDAVYKEDLRQLVLPLRRGTDVSATLVGLLRDLIPEAEQAVAS